MFSRISVLFFFFFVACSDGNNFSFRLDSSKTYLIFRNSETKEGFFIKNFNQSNTEVTHVGILIYHDKSWRIYHALDVKKGNCIKISSIEEFCKETKQKDPVRVLEVVGFSKKPLLIAKMDSVKKQNLSFDFTFSKDCASATYCSKFVCDVLQLASEGYYVFQKKKKKLNNIEAAYLKKDTLEYYPVDLFFNDSNFLRVH